MKKSKTLAEYFWNRVPYRGDGCWEWSGPFNSYGYGRIYFKRAAIMAHRASVIINDGIDAIPPGMNVCHHCDNPRCVRRDHLFLGTQKENLLDGWRKGRMKSNARDYYSNITHCCNGHEFTDENTLLYKRKAGTPTRNCRQCRRERQRKYMERKRCGSQIAA